MACVIPVMGFMAHVRVALYASLGIPSLPCAFRFARFRSSRSMSCSSYSWSIHVSGQVLLVLSWPALLSAGLVVGPHLCASPLLPIPVLVCVLFLVLVGLISF